MTLSTVSSIEQLPLSLQSLIHDLQQLTTLCPDVAQRCLKLANVQCHDIWPWQRFNHSACQSYGQAQIYQGGLFNIIAISWMPGDYSAIYDQTVMGVTQSFGDAEYSEFHYDGDLLSTQLIRAFKTGTTLRTDSHCIHQMGNPSSRPFMSLQIEFHSGQRVSNRVFDLYDASIQSANAPFFCLPNVEIQSKEQGLRGDRLTTLRHHQQMLTRVEKMQRDRLNPAQFQCDTQHLTAEIEFLKQ